MLDWLIKKLLTADRVERLVIAGVNRLLSRIAGGGSLARWSVAIYAATEALGLAANAVADGKVDEAEVKKLRESAVIAAAQLRDAVTNKDNSKEG